MAIFLGIVAFILILLLIPIVFELTQSDGETTVKARYLFFSFALFPQKEKEEKPPKQAKAKKTKPEADKPKKEKKLSFTVEEIIDIAIKALESAGIILKSVFKAITVDKLVLDMIVAKKTASETAQEYGRLHAYIGGAYAVLANVIKIKTPSITINADFYSKNPRSALYCRISVRVLGILWGVIKGAVILLVFFVKKLISGSSRAKTGKRA